MESTSRFGSLLVGFEVYMFHVSAGGDGWSRGWNNQLSASPVLRCLFYYFGGFVFYTLNLLFISLLEMIHVPTRWGWRMWLAE